MMSPERQSGGVDLADRLAGRTLQLTSQQHKPQEESSNLPHFAEETLNRRHVLAKLPVFFCFQLGVIESLPARGQITRSSSSQHEPHDACSLLMRHNTLKYEKQHLQLTKKRSNTGSREPTCRHISCAQLKQEEEEQLTQHDPHEA